MKNKTLSLYTAKHSWKKISHPPRGRRVNEAAYEYRCFPYEWDMPNRTNQNKSDKLRITKRHVEKKHKPHALSRVTSQTRAFKSIFRGSVRSVVHDVSYRLHCLPFLQKKLFLKDPTKKWRNEVYADHSNRERNRRIKILLRGNARSHPKNVSVRHVRWTVSRRAKSN